MQQILISNMLSLYMLSAAVGVDMNYKMVRKLVKVCAVVERI